MTLRHLSEFTIAALLLGVLSSRIYDIVLFSALPISIYGYFQRLLKGASKVKPQAQTQVTGWDIAKYSGATEVEPYDCDCEDCESRRKADLQ